MSKYSYLQEILSGNNTGLLVKEDLQLIVYFIKSCKAFFKMDFLERKLTDKNITIIQHLLQQWFALEKLLNKKQFNSSEAIKQYYDCFKLSPYSDFFDVLKVEIPYLLESLIWENNKVINGYNDPIIKKMIECYHQHKTDFLKQDKAYQQTTMNRYKQVMRFYKLFKQIPNFDLSGKNKEIYYFKISLEIIKPISWAQTYHAIQQMYTCIDKIFRDHQTVVIRFLKIRDNMFEFSFMCMGFSYPDYGYLIASCQSVFPCCFRLRADEQKIKLSNEIEIVQALKNNKDAEYIIAQLKAIMTETDERKIQAVFDTIIESTAMRSHDLDRLWGLLLTQQDGEEELMNLIKSYFSHSNLYRTHLEGLYCFQVINKKALNNLNRKSIE
ncbi:hypothetical protein MTZ49_07315 [Entomomonas sp. E2T0]|uniref:hypothetical protein n=1 Tax=Entomomonas sp. E2T0 TaxID=2930213 RepID=UPI00222816D7|nr:hypothetical protein [Entomomonas sp. E2T0]UYZ85348.1 hypothetical protein MTZ49_07315 [Entomomonas sp. E2T0]